MTAAFALLGMLAIHGSRAQAQVHGCPPNFEAGHSVEYYEVTGSTSEELAKSLDRRGPSGARGRPFHAQTQWCVRWHFVPWKRPDGCELVHVSTTLRTRVTLPRWVGAERASPELMRWWAIFIEVLEAHENAHVANGREAELAIASALAGVGPNASCVEITQTADRLARELYWQYRTRDRQFDRDTRHGIIQLEKALAEQLDALEERP